MKRFIVLIVIIFGAVVSEARYFRFWQGEIKEDLNYQLFVKGLNEIFVPTTGRLAQTDAKLKSYQPFLFSEESSRKFNLPTEIALVEYETEQDYLNFRATPEGQNYSLLHWDYFNQKNSKSKVAENFNYSIESNKAYYFSHDNNFSFYDSDTYFKVYLRDQTVPSDQWFMAIRDHVLRLQQAHLTAVVFLVTDSYLLEYSMFNNNSEFLDSLFEAHSSLIISKKLVNAIELRPDNGLKYNLSNK